jgi:aspartate/methionine/tyrosine aminotransferase
MKYDMGWGHAVAVRQAFLSTYNRSPVIIDDMDLSKFDYPEHEGDKNIIALTKQIIRRQLGLDYAHVLLTNGATGGVVIALRAYKKANRRVCVTRAPPYYLRYPGMIRASGLKHVKMNASERELTMNDVPQDEIVFLLDAPSNPIGLTDNPMPQFGPLILDGVYYNNVYTSGYIKPPPHDVLVGSYSKLLGLNGVRVGWIATNDSLLYERLKSLVTSEYCGLSMADSLILNQVMSHFEWEQFEAKARRNLNRNREEWSRLERYFDGMPVGTTGMFYWGKMDSSCKTLMEKSGVNWTQGSLMGADDRYGRFSLGQDCLLTKRAVNEILKNDGVA